MCGISGSGKTTKAKSLRKNLHNCVIISRDSLRNMAYGHTDEDVFEYYQSEDLREKEKLITKLQKSLVDKAIKAGKTVIIDNTNLKPKYIEPFKSYNLPIYMKVVHEDLGVCIERDSQRVRKVGEEVIKKQYESFKHIYVNLAKLGFEISDRINVLTWEPKVKAKYNFKDKIDPRLQVERYNDGKESLPLCAIFDLDGTLSMMNGRSPYEGSKCGTDEVNYSAKSLLDMCRQSNVEVFIFSGRNSDKGGKEATVKWLEENSVEYGVLSMRKEGDQRKDTIVKGEMFDEFIKDHYQVLFVLDDRDMMVDFWRSKGLDCFQAYYGDF